MSIEELRELKIQLDASRLLIGGADDEDRELFLAAARWLREMFAALEPDYSRDEDWTVEPRLKGAALYVQGVSLSTMGNRTDIRPTRKSVS